MPVPPPNSVRLKRLQKGQQLPVTEVRETVVDTPPVVPSNASAEVLAVVEKEGMFDYKLPPREFTYERRMRFLYELVKSGGLLSLAAARAGVSSSTVVKHRKMEPEFDAAVIEARDLGVEAVLVEEARRRAVDGVDEPVFGGQWKDEVVGYIKRYSDGLLKMLICGAKPEYRDAPRGTSDGKYPLGQGGVVIIPAQQVAVAVPGQTQQQAEVNAWVESFAEAAKGETSE